jgi:hypothetical protein
MNIILESANNCSWLLCIFFSVDIEGATAYKVDRINKKKGEDWCRLFELFYKDFPQSLSDNYAICVENKMATNISQLIRPIVWKFAGDEILFYAPLTHLAQTLEHITAFRKTLIDYNKTLGGSGVQCKGTAWLAGFPINNRIVLINTGQEFPIIDFIGKSIDTGFRLTKFSSPHRLVVSLDLLWVISELRKNNTNEHYKFLDEKIKYDGRHELKGVFSGKPYPVFWIDSYDNPPVEDSFLQDRKVCEHKNIIKFCENLSKSMGHSTFIKPFIVGDDCGQVNEQYIDEYFKQQYTILLSYENASTTEVKNADVPLNENSRSDAVHSLNKIDYPNPE